MYGRSKPLLTSAELAELPDFRLGATVLSPSTRLITGPGGSATIEPRVMQVLVVLADAEGAVVTREELLQRCWGGVYVGDDSLNRAVAGVRRIATGVADGSFTIETIPRTGYRLTTAGKAQDGPSSAAAAHDVETSAAPQSSGRRRVLAAGLAVAVAGGAGLWSVLRSRPDPRAAALVERGEQALRLAIPDMDAQGASLFANAAALEPDNAMTWGLLALARRNAAEYAPPDKVTVAMQDSERAARRALALDPNEGNALTALATLRPYFGDWAAGEDRLRAVLARAPDTYAARLELEIFLQSVGRSRESAVENQRAMKLDPLAPVPHYRLAIKHYIFGRLTESDQTIDRALQTWPRHPGVWNTRLWLFAMTDRPDAALAMIEDDDGRPATMPAQAMKVWRASLRALGTRDGAAIAAARAANEAAARASPGFAINAIMVLSTLGELDSAFAVAEGYLMRRGKLIGILRTGAGQMPVNDQHWRKTMMMFIPATAPMRADPRFAQLCEGTGLARYWRERRIRPDFQRGLA